MVGNFADRKIEKRIVKIVKITRLETVFGVSFHYKFLKEKRTLGIFV
jgi:hypothetical protein